MHRILALNAEVFGGLHDSLAEEVLPNPVHLDPRGQWMVGRYKPLRQPEPIQRRAVGQGRQKRGRGEFHLLQRL